MKDKKKKTKHKVKLTHKKRKSSKVSKKSKVPRIEDLNSSNLRVSLMNGGSGGNDCGGIDDAAAILAFFGNDNSSFPRFIKPTFLEKVKNAFNRIFRRET